MAHLHAAIATFFAKSVRKQSSPGNKPAPASDPNAEQAQNEIGQTQNHRPR